MNQTDHNIIPVGDGILRQIEAISSQYKDITLEDLEKILKEGEIDDGNRYIRIQLVKEIYNKEGKLTNLNFGAWIQIDWNIKDGYPTKKVNKSIKQAHKLGYKLLTECDFYMKALEWLLKVNNII